MDYSTETRETSSSIWALIYLFSAAFVHIFGKYITAPEKNVLIEVITEGFIDSLITLASNLSCRLKPEECNNKIIDKWIF